MQIIEKKKSCSFAFCFENSDFISVNVSRNGDRLGMVGALNKESFPERLGKVVGTGYKRHCIIFDKSIFDKFIFKPVDTLNRIFCCPDVYSIHKANPSTHKIFLFSITASIVCN